MKYLDISGPKGNAYVLMGLVRDFCKNHENMRLDAEAVDEVMDRMMEGDYNDLLRVFNIYLSHSIRLASPRELPGVNTDLYEIRESDWI
tara:strand:- start:2425 stop:2691 length:267 start_codon:yes stop_codon:yes gene_type:complete